MTDRHSFPWKARTIAAQALGWVDPVTKAVVPPVHVATTFVRDADNQYRSGYAYGRADNATVRQAEAVIAALEGAHEAALFGSGMAAATAIVLALPDAVAHRCLAGDVLGVPPLADERSAAFRPSRRLRRHHRSRRGACRRKAGDHQARLHRDAGQSAVDHQRYRGRRRDRARGRRGARRQFHGGDAGIHAAAFARRRPRDAFGIEISQRPFRRDRRRRRGGARGRDLGAHQVGAHPARRHSGTVRGVAAVARPAHARRAGADGSRERDAAGEPAERACHISPRRLSGPCRRIPATPSPRGR